MSGLFWFGVFIIVSSSCFLTTRVRPLPKFASAAVVNCSLKLSNDQKLSLIVLSSVSDGADPPGVIICQKNV